MRSREARSIARPARRWPAWLAAAALAGACLLTGALMSGSAAAAANAQCDMQTPSTGTPEGTFTELQEAVSGVASGDSASFYLTASLSSESDESLAVPAGATVTIDLNGCDLQSTSPSAGHAGIAVPSSATLIVTDSSPAQTGTLEATGGDGNDQGGGGAGIGGGGGGEDDEGGNNGTVAIDGGTVTANGGQAGHDGGIGAGIGGGGGGSLGNAGGAGGTVTISGGTVTATAPAGSGAVGGGGAGIGGGGAGWGYTGGNGATVTIDGDATVAATGGEGGSLNEGAGSGAGIGGGGGSGSGGGSDTAAITIGGSASVTATGGAGDDSGGGAGIGGGSERGYASGGGVSVSKPVSVSGTAVITVSGGAGSGGYVTGAGIGGGGGSTVASSGSFMVTGGTPSLSGELAAAWTVDAGATLDVASGQTVTADGAGTIAADGVVDVPGSSTLALNSSSDTNNGTIVLAGTLDGSGTLANAAAIQLSGTGWSIPGYGSGAGGVTITDNIYTLTFDANGVAGLTSLPSDMYVFAPTMATSGESLPTPTSGSVPAGASVGWYKSSSYTSPGTELQSTTPQLSMLVVSGGTLALYAQYSDLPQTINFTPPAAAQVGDSDTLSAAGGASGEPVVFTSATPAVCTVSGTDGDTVSFLTAGECTIDANQDGNTEYSAAAQGQGSVTVDKAPAASELSVTPASGATTSSDVRLSAAVLGVAGGPDPTGTVTFTVAGDASVGCTDMTLTAASANCDLGALPAGTYTFNVTYSGDANYTAGAGATVTGYMINQLSTSVAVTPSVAAPVYGQPLTATATVTSGGTAVTAGTVQWQVDGSDLGQPVTVSAAGTASSPNLAGLAAGSHTVTAVYSGTGVYSGSSAPVTVVVAQVTTTTSLEVTAATLTATVAALSPGAGTPTGTVQFTVDGQSVGTASLNGGVAALDQATSGAATVSATYEGSSDFTGSSTSTATENPVITAHVTSTKRKTTAGWYAAAVKVTFTCQAATAPLTSACPAAATLDHSGAAQSVTRTIQATDGGVATVTVAPINIDLTKPKISLHGVKSGATYLAPGPADVACAATDKLSGINGNCKVSVRRSAHAAVYKATATNNAGMRATVTVRVKLKTLTVVGATEKHGVYQVRAPHSYLVEIYAPDAKTPPRYLYAVPLDRKPGPGAHRMTKLGNGKWGIRITVTKTMREHHHWTAAVYTGGKLDRIQLDIQN